MKELIEFLDACEKNRAKPDAIIKGVRTYVEYVTKNRPCTVLATLECYTTYETNGQLHLTRQETTLPIPIVPQINEDVDSKLRRVVSERLPGWELLTYQIVGA